MDEKKTPEKSDIECSPSKKETPATLQKIHPKMIYKEKPEN